MIWVGEITKPIGYGEAGRNYLCALAAAGYADVAVRPLVPVRWDEMSGYHALLARYQGVDLTKVDQRVRVCHDAPGACAKHATPQLYNVAMTTWETDRLSIADRFSLKVAFQEVWVPSEHNREVFAFSKIKLPTHVIPHAVTSFERPAVERPEGLRGRYVFLSVGSRNARKNPRGVLEAYLKAFAADDPVCLLYKSWSSKTWDAKGRQVVDVSGADEVVALARELGLTRTPPVVCVDRPISREDLRRLYALSDCFVSAHRGEGFGLAILEAKALGLHCIATGWSGPVDFLEREHDALIEYQLVPVSGMDFRTGFTPDMNWAEPWPEHLVELMRAAVRTRKVGDAGQTRVKNSLEAVGAQMVARLEEIKGALDVKKVSIGRVLARPSVVHVSTFRQPCGVGLYSESLCRAMRRRDYPVLALAEQGRPYRNNAEDYWARAAVTADRKYSEDRGWVRGHPQGLLAALEGVPPGVLHLQHEFGFWRDETSLNPLIRGAKRRGWKVVVTLHTVLPAGLAEEGLFRAALEADAVVTLGRPGLAAMQGWAQALGSSARVLRIEQGCPPAIDVPREQARKRLGIAEDVVLCIHPGFIAPAKRLHEVVQAVAQAQGTLRSAKFLLLVAGSLRDRTDPQAVAHVRALQAHVVEAGVQDLVRLHLEFLSEQDLPVLLSAADFSVLNHDTGVLSDSAVLRGLQAYGVPVCAADVPSLDGVRDDDGVPTGARLHGDVISLASGLVHLTTEPELRGALREKQLRYAAEHPWAQAAAAHEDLYRELVTTS